MRIKTNLIILLLLFGISAHATTIIPLQPSLWEKIKICKWHISCYSQKLGSTITTINATDQISASRAVINTNFSNLNTDKMEVSTTTIGNVVSLPNLATIGTITSGTWNASTLTIAYGGTGSTTLSQYSVLLGSSTNAVGIVQGLGTSGQFLTSNGAGFPPSWQSATVNTSANYTWSGTHLFTNNVTLSPATTTISNASTTYSQTLKAFVGTTSSQTTSGSLVVQQTPNLPSLVIVEQGTTTPVLQVNAGTTTFNGASTLFNQPIAIASGAHNIPDTTGTVFRFDRTEVNFGGMFGTSTTPTTFLATVAGYYYASCSVVFNSNATGYRSVDVVKGSATPYRAIVPAVNGNSTAITSAGVFRLQAGESLTCSLSQTSGAEMQGVTARFYMYLVSK